MAEELVIKNGVLKKYNGAGGEVIIPDGVTVIGDLAFDGCSGLTSIVIPDSVTMIGNLAFCGCSGLTSIEIPDSVTSVGHGAFNGCKKLADESGLVIVNNILYSYYPNYSKKERIVKVPEGVTHIGDRAFMNDRLTQITIPRSVTYIGEDAFNGFEAERFELLGVPEIGSNAFYYSEFKHIFMPAQNPSKIRKSFRENAVITYCEEAMRKNPACEDGKKEYQAFLKRTQKKYCEDPVKNAAVVRYLLENRLLGELLIDDLIERIPEYTEPELRALALSYSNTLSSNGLERMEKKMDKEIKAAVKKQKATIKKEVYAELPLSERAATPFKLSEQAKVELLEEIVLQGTIQDLENVFNTYGSFEFTARALGFALRCSKADVVETLIQHGASFRYDDTAPFVKKYGCKIKVTNRYSYKPNYALLVLKKSDVEDLYPVLKDYPMSSTDERCSSLKLLCAFPAEVEYLQEILYYAVLQSEKEIVNVLRENSITSLADTVHGNETVSMTSFQGMDAETLAERRDFIWELMQNEDDLAWKLSRLLEASGSEKLFFSKPELYIVDWINNRPIMLKHAFGREDVFKLVMEEKVDISKANPRDFVKCLLKCGNLTGLSYALEQKWVSDKKTMMKLAKAEDITDERVLEWLKTLELE